uniref:DRBM domain-containing protein n=1 Tax=Hydatigena taeniaeformis TaxID=6205 RepID=A0A0R3WQA4_HYDTA
LKSILGPFDAELLLSKHSYADLLRLGRLIKVPVQLFKSGPDYCVSFCKCDFISPLGYQEASFKALSAIRALVEKMDWIFIQSFVWKVNLLALLRGFSVTYEVLPTGNRRGDDYVSRGNGTYTGCIHPVERLDLSQRIRGELPPVYVVEELSPSISAPLCLSSGTIKVTHRSLKFRYSCRLGNLVIRGAACDNKRLAKRSAAEKALQAIGINPYPQMARPVVSPPSALYRSTPGTAYARVLRLPTHGALSMLCALINPWSILHDSLVTFSCAEEVFVFKVASQSNVESHFKSSKRRYGFDVEKRSARYFLTFFAGKQ